MFGQLVTGPPGCGKSTYAHAVQQFLSEFDRKVTVVNLDPANENILYDCTIDIRDLIDIDQIMDDQDLGPNGALLFAFDTLENNFDWLKDKLLAHRDTYFLFDLPGQIELFTVYPALQRIVGILEKWGFRLVCVNLVDSFCCTDISKFISAVLISLTEMLNLELPHVNVLSKMDLAEAYGKLPAPLETYTGFIDTEMLISLLQERETRSKFQKLNQMLAELLDEFSLVTFLPLDVSDKQMMYEVQKKCDVAICYPYPI
ncbi:hypothetical protein P9112_009281 [Eukaryota sp. TZLM1-RC]